MLKRARGITLVELLVGMTVAAVLMLAAAPSIGAWIQNSQLRTAAEGLLTGLQLAKADAVRRNELMQFQLVTTLTGGCALSNAGPDWIISIDSAAGACANAPSETVAPRIVQRRAGAEGGGNVLLAATQSSVTFNSLGRVTNAAGTVTIAVNPRTGTCAATGGELRCLRVTVSTAGAVRLCDPAVTANDDPRKCP